MLCWLSSFCFPHSMAAATTHFAVFTKMRRIRNLIIFDYRLRCVTCCSKALQICCSVEAVTLSGRSNDEPSASPDSFFSWATTRRSSTSVLLSITNIHHYCNQSLTSHRVPTIPPTPPIPTLRHLIPIISIEWHAEEDPGKLKMWASGVTEQACHDEKLQHRPFETLCRHTYARHWSVAENLEMGWSLIFSQEPTSHPLRTYVLKV